MVMCCKLTPASCAVHMLANGVAAKNLAQAREEQGSIPAFAKYTSARIQIGFFIPQSH